MKTPKLLILALIALVFTIGSCEKQSEPASFEIDWDSTDFRGNLTPDIISEELQEGIARIGFMQTAVLFTLKVGTEEGRHFLTAIQNAKKAMVPIEVYVFPKTTEIAGVKPASSEAVKAFKSSIQPIVKTKESLPVIPNMATLNALFAELQILNVPWAYKADGCYARAHKMRQHLLAKGWESGKLFLHGQLAADAGTCCAYWGYHVAPLVRVRNGANIELMVLDPSLFSAPVSQGTWEAKCKSTTCSSTVWGSSSLYHGSVYYVNATGTYGTYDHTYSKTNCTIAEYTGRTGCNPGAYPQPTCPI